MADDDSWADKARRLGRKAGRRYWEYSERAAERMEERAEERREREPRDLREPRGSEFGFSADMPDGEPDHGLGFGGEPEEGSMGFGYDDGFGLEGRDGDDDDEEFDYTGWL